MPDASWPRAIGTATLCLLFAVPAPAETTPAYVQVKVTAEGHTPQVFDLGRVEGFVADGHFAAPVVVDAKSVSLTATVDGVVTGGPLREGVIGLAVAAANATGTPVDVEMVICNDFFDALSTAVEGNVEFRFEGSVGRRCHRRCGRQRRDHGQQLERRSDIYQFHTRDTNCAPGIDPDTVISTLYDAPTSIDAVGPFAGASLPADGFSFDDPLGPDFQVALELVVRFSVTPFDLAEATAVGRAQLVPLTGLQTAPIAEARRHPSLPPVKAVGTPRVVEGGLMLPDAEIVFLHFSSTCDGAQTIGSTYQAMDPPITPIGPTTSNAGAVVSSLTAISPLDCTISDLRHDVGWRRPAGALRGQHRHRRDHLPALPSAVELFANRFRIDGDRAAELRRRGLHSCRSVA